MKPPQVEGRFGFDAGSMAAGDAVRWASENGFHWVDFSVDNRSNAPMTWTEKRSREFRDLVARTGVRVGIHTSSAVNMAETSPLMSDAADRYLETVLHLAGVLGCGWAVVHGGYHFSKDAEARMEASIARLRRACAWASDVNVEMWLENHNREPVDAEIHYIPHDVKETRRYFQAVSESVLKWAFNVAHAHLAPEGISGFLDAFGAANLAQVRLNDNKGDREEHLVPGEGNIEFEPVFKRLRGMGYEGPFALAFGTLDDMREWRRRWSALV